MTGFFHRVNSLAPDRVKGAHPEVKRFIKFAIVGGIGAVIDITVLTILVYVFHIPDYLANIVSVACAIVSNFTWNTLWTFPETRQSDRLHKHFAQFALVNIAGLGINELIFVVTDHFLFEPALGQLGIYPAKAFAIAVVLIWNFGINRIWTYRHIEFGATTSPHSHVEDSIPPL
ncbi:MAG TPA: GtrA family protein [Anaerolineae bacterium]|nr:GtrA family protein [Anaerolineae bacterium]